MSIETDVAQHLATELGLTYGDNVFAGPLRRASENQALANAVPHQAIFCLGSGGIDSIPYVDGGGGAKEARFTVQVIVRSKPNDYTTGANLASDSFDALDMNPPTGYFECRALASAPLYIQRDDLDHHVWTINVLLKQQL